MRGRPEVETPVKNYGQTFLSRIFIAILNEILLDELDGFSYTLANVKIIGLLSRTLH